MIEIAVGIKDTFSINIYSIDNFEQAGKYQLIQQLKEHNQTISTLDWSAQNNLLSGN